MAASDRAIGSVDADPVDEAAKRLDGVIDGDGGDAVRGEQGTRTIRNREAPVSGPQLA